MCSRERPTTPRAAHYIADEMRMRLGIDPRLRSRVGAESSRRLTALTTINLPKLVLMPVFRHLHRAQSKSMESTLLPPMPLTVLPGMLVLSGRSWQPIGLKKGLAKGDRNGPPSL